MTFCEKCDSLLVPVKHGDETTFQCLDCKADASDTSASLENYIIKEEVKDGKSRIEVVENFEDSGGITADIRDELRELYRESIGNMES